MNKTPVVSMQNGQIIAAVVVEEPKSTTVGAMPFGKTGEPTRSVYVFGENGLEINYIPAMMERPSSVSQESIKEEVEKLTEGISAPKAEAIYDSIASSYAIIDVENVFEYTPTGEEVKEIEDLYKGMLEQLEAMKGNAGANVGGKLQKYFFKKHLLIQGEKGGGKTYMVSKMIADMDDKIHSETLRGNESIESIDLLGHYIRTEDGGLVWKDGKLTSAFRMAAKGVPTVLFVDEMLRIPKRELNVLVGALSPDSDGNFSLDTSRADSVTVEDGHAGIANSETITIPKNMLWCVGTTNAGAGYSVDTIDEALADRFRTVVKRMGEKEMKSILESVAKEHGHDKKTVTKLLKFYKSFNTLKDSGELNKLINLRHLAEILEYSEDASDIQDVASDLIPTWCSMDQHGYPNETQQSIIEGLIEKEL